MRRRGYIAVEGPIGLGKTSLAQALARELGARLMPRTPTTTHSCRASTRIPTSTRFPAQLYFLLTRHHQQRELKQRISHPGHGRRLSFAKDKIFAALNLAPDELALRQRLQAARRRDGQARPCRLRARDYRGAGRAPAQAQSRFRAPHQLRIPRAHVGGLPQFLFITTRRPCWSSTLRTSTSSPIPRPDRADPRNRQRRPRHPILLPPQELKEFAALRKFSHEPFSPIAAIRGCYS